MGESPRGVSCDGQAPWLGWDLSLSQFLLGSPSVCVGGRISDRSPSSSSREGRVLVPGTPGADLAALPVPVVCHGLGSGLVK